MDQDAKLKIVWDTLVSGEKPGDDYMQAIDDLRYWIIRGNPIPALPCNWNDQTFVWVEVGSMLNAAKHAGSALTITTAISQFMAGLMCCESYYLGTIRDEKHGADKA